jgi:hypothetical protein
LFPATANVYLSLHLMLTTLGTTWLCADWVFSHVPVLCTFLVADCNVVNFSLKTELGNK